METYIRFEENNPLPELSDIFLSTETFCDIDNVNKKFSSEFLNKNGQNQISVSNISEACVSSTVNEDANHYDNVTFFPYNLQNTGDGTAVMERQGASLQTG